MLEKVLESKQLGCLLTGSPRRFSRGCCDRCMQNMLERRTDSPVPLTYAQRTEYVLVMYVQGL